MDLKKKFCNVPFRNFEVIHSGEVSSCCWVSPKNRSYPERYVLGSLANQTVEEIWNSKAARALRRSVLDGSFEFCNQDICPLFRDNGAGLIDRTQANTQVEDTFHGISKQEWSYIESNEDTCRSLPSKLYLNLGYSCNYRCPTCAPSQDKHSAFSKTVDYLEVRNRMFLEKLRNVFLNVKYLFIGSFGEPLYSKSLVAWLKSFRANNFQNDFFMELQTNGSLLNENFWNGLPEDLKKHLTMIQVSLDAATKETYENVRLGGKWEVINRNLKFISEIETVKSLTLNFVVQESNFREMPAFVELAERLNCRARFTRVQQWPATSSKLFAKMNVFDSNHPSHQEFLNVLENERLKDPRIDMRELLDFLQRGPHSDAPTEGKKEMNISRNKLIKTDVASRVLSKQGLERVRGWSL